MKRFLREYLLENWTLKATALMLSLILWLFVRGEPGPERVVAVPLEIELPRQMEIINDRPTSVEVTMRGAVFSNMWFSQPLPTCVINLQNAREGEHVIRLSPENVRTPKSAGIEILQVSPARVILVLERTVSKEVPVVVPIRGQLPQGFEIYDRYSKPATVTVSGPSSRVTPVREIPTDAVSIAGQKQSTRFFVGLNVRDNLIRTSLTTPVLVEIEIGPRRKLHTVARVPVTVTDPSFAAVPRQVSIQLLTPVDLIPDIKPADFSVIVDVNELDRSQLPAKTTPRVRILNNPFGAIVVRDVYPSEITIRRK